MCNTCLELLERVRTLRTSAIEWILLCAEERGGSDGTDAGETQLADYCAGASSGDDVLTECAQILVSLLNDVELISPEKAISLLAIRPKLGKITSNFAIRVL